MYHDVPLFPPTAGALAVTARRDDWGYWSLTVSVRLDGPEGPEWVSHPPYTELTREELLDVLEALGWGLKHYD